jgi:hypothetical protein
MLEMSSLPKHFGAPRRLAQLHVRLREGAADWAGLVLLGQPDDGEGDYVLMGMCYQQENAVAILAHTGADAQVKDGQSPQLLKIATRALQGWNEMLGVTLGCDPRRIQWAAVDQSGYGFVAVSGGKIPERTWLSLADVAPGSTEPWAGLRAVFPEYADFARSKLAQIENTRQFRLSQRPLFGDKLLAKK